jgi:predicted regulator of Ras-like GTPase activity (Roadblock/LC7/MglB family)
MTGSTLLGCIIQGMLEEWSGTIDVNRRDETLGQVVLARGKIAWATSNQQTENLASLVWRLSHITSEQLSAVSKTYYRHKGKKKIGAILAEEGLMTRPVLRRCMMLHIRFALANLFAFQDVMVDPRPESLVTDDEILFFPEEVVPFSAVEAFTSEWIRNNRDEEHWAQVSAQSYLLQPLFALPGYLASAVISAHGGVVVAHRSVDWLEPKVLGVMVANLLETSTDMSTAIELGQPRSTMVECTEGRLVARWVDDERQFACVAMTTHDGDLPSSLAALEQICTTLTGWLRKVCGDAAPEESEG